LEVRGLRRIGLLLSTSACLHAITGRGLSREKKWAGGKVLQKILSQDTRDAFVPYSKANSKGKTINQGYNHGAKGKEARDSVNLAADR